MASINFAAVIVAAAASFVLGFLFHGPVSGKLWMKLANIHPTGKEKFSDMTGQMFWNFVVNIITATGLSAVYLFLSASPYSSGVAASDGIIIAIIVWLGFLVTSSSIGVIWMKQSSKLWIFEAVCSLICMIAMGLIIACW